MAKNETVPVNAATLKADADALAALKKISDYKPANADYTLDKLQAVGRIGTPSFGWPCAKTKAAPGNRGGPFVLTTAGHG